jgi:hypothetical protein
MAEIKGTNVASKIVPYTDSDEYATHDEKYGVGGYRTVDSVSEMNAIPAARRKEGMLVYVKNDRYYRLNSSNTFEDAGIGSSGGGDIYMVNTDNLNFELISDGKAATDNELAEVMIILKRWGFKVIPLYLQTSADRKGYVGVLNFSIVDGSDVVFSIPYNDAITLYSLNLSTNNWSVLDISAGGGGSGLDWDSAHNFSQNGYQKFNNGLMIQWGRVGGSSTAWYSVTMPTSFYNTEYKIFATVYKPSSDSAIYSASPIATNKTVSRFYLNRNFASGGTTGLSQESWDWFAIGRWK